MANDNYSLLDDPGKRAAALVGMALKLHDRMVDLRIDLPSDHPAKKLLWEALGKSDELMALLDQVDGTL